MAEEFDFFTGGIEDMSGIGTQKTLHMIFVVDNSGSMRGEGRMDAVNEAFRRMIPALQKNAGQLYRTHLRFIFPLWHLTKIRSGLQPPRDRLLCTFSHCSQSVCNILQPCLSGAEQEAEPQRVSGAGRKMAAPYIMLLTDGAPTEGDNYESALEELKHNAWFKLAQRYAYLSEKIPSMTLMPAGRLKVRGTGNEEGIIDAADAEAIAQSVSAKTLIIMDQMTAAPGRCGEEGDSQGLRSAVRFWGVSRRR